MYLNIEQNLYDLSQPVDFAGININVVAEASFVLNLLQELWSMLEFMMPDIFASEDVDLKKLLNAEDRDLIGRMKSILGPFILRRLKSDVMQQLVPKIQQVCLSPLVQNFLFYYTQSSTCPFFYLLVTAGWICYNGKAAGICLQGSHWRVSCGFTSSDGKMFWA